MIHSSLLAQIAPPSIFDNSPGWRTEVMGLPPVLLIGAGCVHLFAGQGQGHHTARAGEINA